MVYKINNYVDHDFKKNKAANNLLFAYNCIMHITVARTDSFLLG